MLCVHHVAASIELKEPATCTSHLCTALRRCVLSVVEVGLLCACWQIRTWSSRSGLCLQLYRYRVHSRRRWPRSKSVAINKVAAVRALTVNCVWRAAARFCSLARGSARGRRSVKQCKLEVEAKRRGRPLCISYNRGITKPPTAF